MTSDPLFKEIFDKIPERDQMALLKDHGVTGLKDLMTKKNALQQRQLEGVCPEVQLVLEHLCTYLETLDKVTSFSWQGFENFCGYVDASGESFAQDFIKNKQDDEAKAKAEAAADPDGFNLRNANRWKTPSKTIP